jgi:hypothetical protein
MNLVQGRRLHSGNLQSSVLSHCKLRLQSETVADTSFYPTLIFERTAESL